MYPRVARDVIGSAPDAHILEAGGALLLYCPRPAHAVLYSHSACCAWQQGSSSRDYMSVGADEQPERQTDLVTNDN